MVGWYHRLHEHEFEQALGDGGQGGQELQSMGWERVGHKRLSAHTCVTSQIKKWWERDVNNLISQANTYQVLHITGSIL